MLRTRSTVEVADTCDLPFQCESCGKSALARVHVRASSERLRPLGIGADDAQTRNTMEQEAFAKLHRRAAEIVERARCPRCRARPRRYLSTRFAGFAKPAITYLALIGGCGAASLAITDGAPLLGLGLLFFGGALGLDLYERLRTGDRQIEWRA